MEYHRDGFRPGDPHVAEAREPHGDDHDLDVLIVGSGPAGLTLATQLCAFPDLRVRLVERNPGPLTMGRADGVACRSMEMFEAFGFAHRVAREAYWVNETIFWRPGPDGHIVRADRIDDVEHDLSEMPHTILSQARIHDFFLETMRNSPHRLEPHYATQFAGLVQGDRPGDPLRVTLERLDDAGDVASTETVTTRYLVGCDGARSSVRSAMGLELAGASARQLWGVMDVLAVTDFPDIRFKCPIQSEAHGSVLVIPREGGHLVRLYIELDELGPDERAADRDVRVEQLIDQAGRVLAPYTLDVREVAWFSTYEIGQRVCDRFDEVPEADRGGRVPQVFIAGDACHTHSPKAGQGMNVSMADAFNLGWKLGSVLEGRARPELLHTYTSERQAKAAELIAFDKDMARLFSEKPADENEAARFQEYFQRHGRYTAGVETRYEPSMLTGSGAHHELAAGQVVGMRFHSAPVVRVGDGKPMQLGHALAADGRWRIVVFAAGGDRGRSGAPVDRLCRSLIAPGGVLDRFTPAAADVDSVIDVRAVFPEGHRTLSVMEMPALLRPAIGRLGLVDRHKVFAVDERAGDIYDMRGIDRERGAVVVVRPDQYISDVLPLDDAAALAERFAQVLLQA